MEVPQYEADGRIAEIVASAAVAVIAGLVLWPPGAVYWTGVADAVGELPTLVLVGLLALGAGLWFERLGGFQIGHVAVGLLVAYGLSMAGIELALSPTSPAHLVWYGAIGAAFVAGAGLWVGIERFREDSART